MDWNPAVDWFTFSTLFFFRHAQISFYRMKWVQFPLTSYFFPWSVTMWPTHPPYNWSISCPSDNLKRTNSNSSTRKIRLTSVTNSQAAVHKSWVTSCSSSAPEFSCNNLDNCHCFNHSQSLSIQHKYFLLAAPLSGFQSFK